MSQQTTIRLFLKDGNPLGRIKCSFSSGWSGIAYKIPFSDLEKCNDEILLKKAGIYFLFGFEDEAENLEQENVYIGQGNVRANGEGVLYRINESHPSIPNWKYCVIFVAQDDSIGPSELNYLEHEFTKLAIQAGRYVVKNAKKPNLAKLSEEQEADMSLFIKSASVLLSTLGYKVLEPTVSKHEKNNNCIIYTYKFKGLIAKGVITNDGFVLLKGSQLWPETDVQERWKDKIPSQRKQHEDKIKDLVTTGDILFRSSSGAAVFCSGQSVSGPKNWFDKNHNSIEENSKVNI